MDLGYGAGCHRGWDYGGDGRRDLVSLIVEDIDLAEVKLDEDIHQVPESLDVHNQLEVVKR